MLDLLMRQMGWKPHWQHTAKCVWAGCDGSRGKDGLLCAWHKSNPAGIAIDRSITA